VGLLIKPEELPRWVPGELLRCSDGRSWNRVALRAYRYKGLDVAVPAMADYMIVSYKRGSTMMERRFEGRWTRTECHPCDLSLLTRSQASHWHWTQEIDVAHVYLSETLVAKVAADALDREIVDVRLHDLLRVRDPVVTTIVDAISEETSETAIGGALYVEALSTQLTVHLLRRYASVRCVDRSGRGEFPPSLKRHITEYIECHLGDSISLEQLAAVAAMGAWSFGKRFRASFGQPPHDYVMCRRLERARRLLSRAEAPIKAVAAACGFADQAHLTRVCQAKLGTTPAALRRLGG